MTLRPRAKDGDVIWMQEEADMTNNFSNQNPLEYYPNINDQEVVDRLRAEAMKLARGEDARRAMRRYRAGFSIEN